MFDEDRIKRAFEGLDRSYFLDDNKDLAHLDRPLSIGHEQTISQPSLVLHMTELLDPREDSRILEIGTGSGYQTALLSKLSGEVYTVERIEELYEKSKDRLLHGGYSNVKFKLDDGSKGWKEYSPYDGIMVTAAAENIPEELIDQLSPGGRMIIPVGDLFEQDLMVVEKDMDGNISKESVFKVRFVPLIQNS